MSGPGRRLFGSWAWLPVPILLGGIVALRVFGPQGARESWLLSVAFNALFSTVTSLFVASLAGGDFLVSGSAGSLFLGCGALFWSGAGLLAMLLGHEDANVAVTIHNACAALSAACHLAGVLLAPRSRRPVARAWLALPVAYAGVAAVAALVVLSARSGALPTFFVQGFGGTPIRQAVLGSAVMAFAAAAAVLVVRHGSAPSPFLRWYSMALALVSVGLLGVLLQSSVASTVGWLGRSAQFLGGVYMLVAVTAARQRSEALATALQASLRASEQRLESLVEIAPDAIIAHQDGRFVYANAAALRLYGARHPADLLGRTVLDLVHPDDTAAVGDRIAVVAKGGVTPLRALRVVRLDGRVVPVETTAASFEYRGRPAVQVILRDISERVRAEQRMLEHAVVLEEVADAVIGFDLAGRITSFSQRAEQMYGYRAEEVLGRPSVDVLKPVYLDMTREQALERLMSTGRLVCEAVHTTRDGRSIAVESRASLLRGARGEPIGFVGFNLDISERKRAAERMRALQEVTAELAAALTREDVGRVVLGAGARVSGAAAGVLGTLVADGREIESVHSFGLSEELRERWRRCPVGGATIAAQAVRTGRRVEAAPHADAEAASLDAAEELRARGLRSGVALPLLIEGRPLGAAAFFFGARSPVAEAERAFLESIAAQAALALERARLYQDAERRAAELRDAAQRKDEFLGVLSHELRNPLAPIRSSLFVLEHAEPGGPEARRAQAVMGRQLAHLVHLVDDLMDVTRISRGRIRLDTKRLDLCDLVRAVAEDHRDTLASAGIELRQEIAAGPLPVDGDATRLSQAVGNLLSNAAKFTPRGGSVRLCLAEQEGRAVIRVEDTGAGLSPAMLALLFEPFAQARQPLDRSQGGLGLGLALVKAFVEMHGGSVSAHSEGEGKGATFTLVLPLVPVHGGQGAALSARAKTPRRPRRILVIEDNIDAAESLQSVLRLRGHEVAVAHRGLDGLSMARAFRPDAVLCDLGLPGVDGYEVARRLRADRDLGAASLIALSGYALPDDVERAREAGFDHHLAKPADVDAIEALLAQPTARRAV